MHFHPIKIAVLVVLTLVGSRLIARRFSISRNWAYLIVTLILFVGEVVFSVVTSCKPKPAPAKPYEPLPADTVRPRLEQNVKQAESTRVERTHESNQTQKPYEKAAADYDAERRRLGL